MFHEFTKLVAESSEWAYVIVFLFAFLDALVRSSPARRRSPPQGWGGGRKRRPQPRLDHSRRSGWGLPRRQHRILRREPRDDALLSGEKARRRIEWAHEQLDERGGELIVVARFIPGRRTAVTLSAGTLGYPWRRFVVFDAAAALGWALYSALLGYYGGRTFEGAKGLVLALVTAFAVAGGIELARWALKRRRRRA